MFTVILIVSLIIVVVIMSAAVITTSKAYSYKHTIDPIENNPNIKKDVISKENTVEPSDKK